MSLLTNKNFIVFGEDFARHPHALEHILRPLFNQNRFIWVETIGLRSPKFSVYDFKRIYEKIKIWLSLSKNDKSSVSIPKNITIVAPFMIPFNQFKLVRMFNTWIVTKNVNTVIKKYNLNNLITITSVPNACDYVGKFNEKLKVYFCVDEFSLWPGLDLELVQNLEQTLLSKVDLVVATSEALSFTKKINNKKTNVITHGVEFEHFNIETKDTFSSPVNICYFGLFDERSDQDIIYNLATKISNVKIHILGNVVCDIQKLKAVPTIIFHGKIEYSKLPQRISDMDIFILPYVRNELTNNINPLKLKEYLATGRPVIATALPEVVKLNEYLFVRRNSEEFIQTVQDLIQKKITYNALKTINYVRQNETWMAKADYLSSLIEELLHS